MRVKDIWPGTFQSIIFLASREYHDSFEYVKPYSSKCHTLFRTIHVLSCAYYLVRQVHTCLLPPKPRNFCVLRADTGRKPLPQTTSCASKPQRIPKPSTTNYTAGVAQVCMSSYSRASERARHWAAGQARRALCNLVDLPIPGNEN